MIDWARVSELCDAVGHENFDGIYDIFVDEVRQALTQLQSENDISDIKKTLHFVSGCAANLGFSDLYILCQKNQTAPDSPEKLADQTKACFEQSCDVFKRDFDTQISPTRVANE